MWCAHLPGVNVLLEGPSGTGKTYSISTLVNSGYEVFLLFLEPGIEALIAPWADRGAPVPPNLHWHIMAPPQAGFDDLRRMIDESGKFTQKMLSNSVDPNRGKNNPVLPVIDLVNDFKDHRTGKSFGPVAGWDTKRVFVIDHLTALSEMFLRMLTGNKAVSDLPDYGIAQTNFMQFQKYLINSCKCHFVMIAHVDRYIDEIHGGMRLMTKSIGKAIAGDIPIPYSDVILSRREGDKFYWDTAESNADVKTRNLSIQSKLPPDFGVILKKWEARNAAAGVGNA
jgi:hypothetical protein